MNKYSTISQVLYQGDKLRIGHFHLSAEHPEFAIAGPIERPTLVFPRTPTYIQQYQRHKFLSQPNHVNVYDGQRPYTRSVCDERGDICDWFEFHPSLLAQALTSIHVDSNSQDVVMDVDHLCCSAQIYWTQRLILNNLLTQKCDLEAVEEIGIQLLADVLDFGLGHYARLDKRASAKRAYAEICHEIQKLIIQDIDNHLSLEDIAQAIGVSTFHMCRVFKKLTGESIHQYRQQLRLRFALDYLAQESDISKVALDLGFSSHSHFSTAFYKSFGYQPKHYKKLESTNSSIGA
ncbi:MAG: helix-turn-helix domain-containing protein [Aestuariibacter sp.]